MEAAQLQSLSAVAAVSSVITVCAVERIPEEYKRQSFFGEYDLWLYVPVYDDKLCPKCEAFAHLQVFRGNELRRSDRFPYLAISDEDKILAHVHPNCRCELYRVISFERYLRLLEKLEKREGR